MHYKHPQFRLDARVALAFAAIYVFWGGTFLAIRVAVLQLPPFFASGVRFSLPAAPSTSSCGCGVIPVRPWAVAQHCSDVALPLRRDLCVAFLGGTVRALRRRLGDRGDAAPDRHGARGVRLSTAAFPATDRRGTATRLSRRRVASAQESTYVPGLPCLIILASGTAWSLGAVFDPLNEAAQATPALNAGAQMLLGGMALLALSKATGELRRLPRSRRAPPRRSFILILAGSLFGFTAYVWLLARMPVTRVASHAYVNPLVALALGHFVAGKP